MCIFAIMEYESVKILYSAILAALEAGDAIMRVYEEGAETFGVEYKADHSPLTRADKAAHRIIADRLAAGSSIPLLSEEGRHGSYAERKAWDTLWIVDPLDGTKEFIKRNGEFTVNIALVREGVPVMGVVYAPVYRLLYYASEETGARRVKDVAADGLRPEALAVLGVSLPVEEKHTVYRVMASRSHMSPETEEYLRRVEAEHGTTELISKGSSLKIVAVADGTADEYPRFGPTMEWDTAAADAVARIAGARVTDARTGSPLQYNKEDLHNPWFIVKR